MNNYKFSRAGGSFYMSFLSMEAALDFALLLEPMQVEESPSAPVLDNIKRLESDKNFSLYLMDRFVKDNRAAGITEPQSLALMAQFKDILSFAQVGAVGSVYSLLQGITPGEIYTQERKDKDLNDINNYLNSF